MNSCNLSKNGASDSISWSFDKFDLVEIWNSTNLINVPSQIRPYPLEKIPKIDKRTRDVYLDP